MVQDHDCKEIPPIGRDEENTTKCTMDNEFKEVDEYEQSSSTKTHEPHVPPMRGVQLIENVKTAMDDSKRGNIVKAVYGTSILVCAWAASLDASTTNSLQPLATSSFGAHSSLATINIANGIIGAVSNPILAKFADLISRTFIYIISVFFIQLVILLQLQVKLLPHLLLG